MSPDNKCRIFVSRVSVFALCAAIAGCSLNPFGGDEEAAAPVERTTTTHSGSSSLDPAAAAASQSSGPTITLVQQAVPLAEGHPDEYTVLDGDTLWDIAATFLRDPWYWPEVWYVNPQVENPHLIYPGDVLALVTIDGRQRITTVRASTYRMSPAARITPLDESIESIPYEQISAFLSKGLVIERGQADDLPYILSVRGEHMVAAAGNEIYVRGGAPAPNGTRYSVVHVGDELRDPDDGDLIGYQGIYVGEGTLSRGGDPATISLNETTREAMAGDRLVPETVDIPLNFFPKAPNIDIEGRIISVVGGVSLIGQFQVIVLNRGARHGLAPGDVLAVYQDGDYVRDRFSNASMASKRSLFAGEKVKLPDEEAGTVMVFKVYDRIGYALVMEATDAIRVLDTVRNPY